MRAALPAFRPAARRAAAGTVLISVIWIIGLMSLLLVAFLTDAHIESRVTFYNRRRAQAEYIARSGAAVARMLMAKSLTVAEDAEDPEDAWLGHAQNLKRNSVLHVPDIALGEGTLTLDIVPEDARRSIGRLGETDQVIQGNLERVLEVGGVPEELWPDLIDCYLDWVDADDTARPRGAESPDTYSQMDPPYEADNGPVDEIGDLRLIKGWTRDILYGGIVRLTEDPRDPGVRVNGIADLLTTYGSGKVNINAATTNVLRTLPGVDVLAAAAVVQERDGWLDSAGDPEMRPFTGVQDLLARVPGLDPSTMQSYVDTRSSVFRITSSGMVFGVRRTVWFIAEYKDQELKIKRWREQD